MKKITSLFSLLLCFVIGTVSAAAQIAIDGDGSAALGTQQDNQYTYTSPTHTVGGGNVTKIRFVFLSTNTGNNDTSGRHPYVHFAEFYLFDANGNQVTLEASNFSSNATQTNEGGLAKLCDGITTGANNEHDWYWHSTWSSTPNCDHYLQISVPDGTDLSSFSYRFISRNTSCIPKKIMVVTGDEAIAAHDILNAKEQENELGTFPADGGRVQRALDAAKAEFQTGNTTPDYTELDHAVEDRNLTVLPLIIGTLSLTVGDDMTDTGNRKSFDGSTNDKYKFTVAAGTKTVRMTVKNTNTEAKNNGHVFFTLAELSVYLGGTAIELENSNLISNANHNETSDASDGSGYPALWDGNTDTYFHSSYKNGPAADHYLQFDIADVPLTEAKELYITFTSRNGNNIPTNIEFSYIVSPLNAKHEALVNLNSRIGELLGRIGTQPGQYDKTSIETATATALGVLRNTEATTEQLTAALEALNVSAENAMVLFEDGTKVLIGNEARTGRYVYAEAGDNRILQANSANNSYAYIWTLIKSGLHKFKFYNEYTGKYFGPIPRANQTNLNLVDNKDDAGEYKVDVTEGGFYTISVNDPSLVYPALHLASDHDRVVTWALINHASHFSLITDITETCKAYDNALIAQVEAMIGETYYGQIKEESIRPAINTLSNTSSLANYKALEAAVAKAEHVLPEAGKIYQIVSQTEANNQRQPGDLLYAEPTAAGTERFTTETDRQMRHKQPQNIHIPNSYWTVESSDLNKAVYFRHLNSGLYAGQLPNNQNAQLPLSQSDAGKYSFSYLADVSAEKNTDVYMLWDEIGKSYLHSRYNTAEAMGYNVATENASRWTLREVTEVPVSIGSVKYATLNLPFAVNIPANVEAYIGAEENENEITLQQIEGVIPANTAVILVATEADTYNFYVATDNTDSAPENALSGTTTAETFNLSTDSDADTDTDPDIYILKNGTYGIGMYKVTSTTDRTVPANKAFLKIAKAQEAEASMFKFGFGDATGVGNLDTNSQTSNTYYDLNGRRVLNPTRGVYVKANGEKVFIK